MLKIKGEVLFADRNLQLANLSIGFGLLNETTIRPDMN